MQVEILDPGRSELSDPVFDHTCAVIILGLLERRKVKVIADSLGITVEQVRQIRHSERYRQIGREMFSDVVDEARTGLIGLLGDAIGTIAEILQDASGKGDPTRLAAALAIIDRANHVVPENIEGQIRRIISRVPRSSELASGQIPPQETGGESAATVAPAQPATYPIDAPENYGIPATRRSVRQLQVNEQRGNGGRFTTGGTYRAESDRTPGE